MRVVHASSRDVDVEGEGPAVVRMISFDDPHVAAGTVLRGEYPSGVVDWGDGGWAIAAPGGKFGTFNLRGSGEFKFVAPRVFAGVDVYNGGEGEAVVRLSSEGKEVSYKIEAGELRRVRTGVGGGGVEG